MSFRSVGDFGYSSSSSTISATRHRFWASSHSSPSLEAKAAYSMILGSGIHKLLVGETKEENLKCRHLCQLEGGRQVL